MFDCHKEITDFHKQEVTLKKSQQDEMRNRRDANRKRLHDGLSKSGKPLPIRHVAQGSYAMHTMVQDKDNDYDIDDGAVFKKADLVGDRGAEMSALDARKMVRDALDDGSFEKPPEVRNNCVRVYYKAGYHVDIPVYRELEDSTLELASSEWNGSSPTEVTDWYQNSVTKKSPDNNNGQQMRRITRLIKAFMRSRDSWKCSMPSGLELSVLIDERYTSDCNREDVALYETMKCIRDRLIYDLEIKHPVRNEMLTDGPDDANTRFLREILEEALDNLEILFEPDCTRLDALKAWNKVLKHKYWEDLIAEEKKKQNNKEKGEAAAILRGGNTGLSIASGVTAAFIAAKAFAEPIKTTRSYGGKVDW